MVPLVNRIKGFEERHKSVAPKYLAAALDRSLFFSPSNMSLNLKDHIFEGSSRVVQSGHHTRHDSSKKGYSNIFRNRSLVPSEADDLTSPKGSMARQENYLQKISSEKRNIVSMKKFANSGMGPSHKPYFVRKIS